MDDLTLGVLLGAEGDDGGLAAARVGAELGVDVGLDDLGHRLGLNRGKKGGRVVVSRVLPASDPSPRKRAFSPRFRSEFDRRQRRSASRAGSVRTWILVALRAETEPVKEEVMKVILLLVVVSERRVRK